MLRYLTHHGQLDELKKACANPANDYRELLGNATYIKFAEFYHNREVDRRFNEFAASPEIRQALSGLQLEVTPVPLFLSLIYGKDVNPKSLTPETNPSNQSPVIAAMGNITQDYFWGAHHDLNFLASLFKVNFHCLRNGSATYSPIDLRDRHTIKLNHEVVHWTTSLNRAKVRPGISFNESGETLVNIPLKEPLINYIPVVAPTRKKRKTKELTKEELSPHALKLPASLTPLNDDPLAAVPKEQVVGPKLPFHTNMEPRRKTVRFHFSPSQLEDQRRHNLKLLDYELEETSKRAKVHDDEVKQLEFLRGAVSRATIAYIEYSESIWFSLFHRHGNTGRVRARTFHERFLDIENSMDAKRNLIRFLANDNNNGNTYPHSFRTMLLQELQASPRTLQYTSQHFDDLLEELALVLSVNIDTVRPQR